MTTRDLIFFVFVFCAAHTTIFAAKNVLFLVADDMRPQLGCYSGSDFPSPVHPKMLTPNLDHLASKSMVLKRAYVQQAICSPSRTSLLTGRRPDTTHVYDLHKYFRDVGGNFTTIPQVFKNHGYVSVGMGKIFHPGHASHHDDPPSWNMHYYHSPNEDFWTGKNHRPSWLAVNKTIRDKHPLPDEQIASQAVKTLKYLANQSKPFFMAVGFHKPHLPFIFPEKFLKLYPADAIQLPPNPYAPKNMPDIAWSDFSELRKYKDIKKFRPSGEINSTLPKNVTKDLRRAYYAAVSYVDSLIGDLLKTLKDLRLDDNTIVSFWGDHGWHLGENGEWTKHTNFEQATHAPMMVHIPGKTDQGIEVEELTEFVDLFPTLVDAAELPSMPLCSKNSSATLLCTEGMSLMPFVNVSTNFRWKKRVFSQYPRNGFKVMGYSMRTDRYRYTEWPKFDMETYEPNWDKLKGVELYDHKVDPEENVNRADDPGYKLIRQGLSKFLRRGWRAARPTK